MGYKSVSLTHEVYELLKAAKKENESFNDVIKRLFRQPSIHELLTLAGAWDDVSEEELEALRKAAKGDSSVS
ncbi:MAG: antitoxin VapB family protein [Promethearchaeota archaeon]